MYVDFYHNDHTTHYKAYLYKILITCINISCIHLNVAIIRIQ